MSKNNKTVSDIDKQIASLTQKRNDAIEYTCTLFANETKRIIKAKKAFDIDMKTFSAEFSAFIDNLKNSSKTKSKDSNKNEHR